MNQSSASPGKDATELPPVDETVTDARELASSQQERLARLRLIWSRRRFLLRATAMGLLGSTLIAALIPTRYTATTQLMPPDSLPSSGVSMLAALASRGDGGLGAVAGDLVGTKSSGALFIGVLRSETSQDRLVQQFDLEKIYGRRMLTDARRKLDESTSISEDRKSGIITISVTDGSPQRAAALASAYVDQLNSLVTELSTSAAHRERVFLDERLKVVKQDLDEASNQLAQFSSKNNTLDIQTEGRAMLDAAANLDGQLIAAQSELEGLRQIYTANNPRVRSLDARVGELRRELEKLGGTNATVAKAAGQPADRSADMPYPSMRNLPLLGVKYADYFRRAKTQETVFELLTEQSEMAKVQEAKETPSVKVLDPARVPERKSYPPRVTIIFLCTLLALAGATAWVVTQARWEEVDPEDPGKVLMDEVFRTVNARMPWAAPNGSRVQAATHLIWTHLVRRKSVSEGSESLQK